MRKRASSMPSLSKLFSPFGMLVYMFMCLIVLQSNLLRASAFYVGVGSYDATGPIADVAFMGYVSMDQKGEGLHMRQRARAFVIGSDDAKVPAFAFVSLDVGMGSQIVTRRVLERLNSRFPGVYTLSNLLITGTHTHAAPGGYSQYVIPQLSTMGFIEETFSAIVDATVEAVTRAHLSAVAHVKVEVGVGKAEHASNINRSPTSYAVNPKQEQLFYTDGDTDKFTTVLKFTRQDGVDLGLFAWFSVHGTSLPSSNKLVSGDNKGYASLLYESWVNSRNSSAAAAGNGAFVAAFPSTSLGDVSPNVNGTKCRFSHLPCEARTSTCLGLTEFCTGHGPSTDAFESNRIIGTKQAVAARKVSAYRRITEPSVRSLHRVVNFESLSVNLTKVGDWLWPESLVRKDRPLGYEGVGKTCKAALGYSFAAGTTDGPGIMDFHQAAKRTTPFWNAIRNIITTVPSKAQVDCQAPKPILLPVGEAGEGLEPHTMAITLSLIGKSFGIVSVPAEFTTMAGRRLRRVVQASLVRRGLMSAEGVLVVSGLTNAYSHYVTTYEEYQEQRYEAASTLYGPHTLSAYLEAFDVLARRLAGEAAAFDESEARDVPDHSNLLIRVVSPSGPDSAKTPFGKVFSQPKPTYDLSAIVAVEFYSADPRHDSRRGDTYFAVERLTPAGDWVIVATDDSLDTRLKFYQHKGMTIARVEWRLSDVHLGVPRRAAGDYRVVHRATRMRRDRSLIPFVGVSNTFRVVSSAIELEIEQDAPVVSEWRAFVNLPTLLFAAAALGAAGWALRRGRRASAGEVRPTEAPESLASFDPKKNSETVLV